MDPNRLKTIPLFESLPEDDLRKIAAFAGEVSIEKGARVVDEGDFSYHFMAIEDGEAEVLRDDQHVADLSQGDFFGEIGLLERERRNATVVAKSPMRLITLTVWDLRRMEKEMPETFEKIRRVMEERKPATGG